MSSANTDGGYTRIGSGLWNWEPWKFSFDIETRMLWLALYTSPHAKRIIPGLWEGSVHTMADAAILPFESAVRSLDFLLDHDLAEYDTKYRVLRLVTLPDAGEWPFNGSILRSWYNRFKMVADCPVRDAHIPTLWWMIERGSKESKAGKVSQQHHEIWGQTFGLVQIPPSRRRGTRRVADNDTSTTVQPSLFAPVSASSEHGADDHVEHPSVDNSIGLTEISKSNKIRDSVMVSTPYGEGEGEGEGVGEGFRNSGEGGLGGGAPILTLVPMPPVLTGFAAALLATFREVVRNKHWTLDEAQQARFSDTIELLGEDACDTTLALLREWLEARGWPEVSREIVCQVGALPYAIRQAREWKRVGEAKAAAMQAAREQAGI